MTWKQWSGQVTTGIGILIGTPTMIALISGQITWQQAIPPMVAAVIGLVFPENHSLASSGQDLATSVEKMIVAYEAGQFAREPVNTAPPTEKASP